MHSVLWTCGYGLLIVLIAGCGILFLRAPPCQPLESTTGAGAARAINWASRGRWVFLAAVPSGLLIAVTAHISTDVAAAPLLWVLPLSVYLLTWVLVFQARPLLPHRLMLLLQPLAIVSVIMLLAGSTERNLFVLLGGHLFCFFVIAMACHGELARTRPPAQHLTGFYVVLSLGGMVGGLFAGLIGPFSFSWIAEYPLLVALAALGRPGNQRPSPARGRRYCEASTVLAVRLIAPSYLSAEAAQYLDHLGMPIVIAAP